MVHKVSLLVIKSWQDIEVRFIPLGKKAIGSKGNSFAPQFTPSPHTSTLNAGLCHLKGPSQRTMLSRRLVSSIPITLTSNKPLYKQPTQNASFHKYSTIRLSTNISQL